MIAEKISFNEKVDELFARIFSRFIYKKYVNSFELKGNEKVLEMGCGSGNLSKFILDKLTKEGFLTGADISKYWLSNAKNKLRKYDNVEFKLGEIAKLNIKDSYYDVVVIHYVLHDIEESERLKILRLIRKKLKKNGIIYIREPTRKSHGIAPTEIEKLMNIVGLKEIYSKESFSLLLRQIFIGVFKK